MERHLLLTGGTGYLGSAMLAQLQHGGLFDRITATFHQTKPLHHPWIQYLPFSGILNGDLDLSSVSLICHLGVPRVRSNDLELAQAVISLKQLLLSAAEAGVAGFVFASSQAVYGTSKPPWRESDLAAPVTPYGWHKFAGEQIMGLIASGWPSIHCLSLRFPKLIGPGRGFRLHAGEWIHGLAYAAIHNQEIQINSPFLTQQFDFMDVRDAASACIKILSLPPDTWPEVLNVGSNHLILGSDLIEAVNAVTTSKLSRELRYRLREGPGQSRSFGMNVDALRNYLGSIPQRTLNETIADICLYIHGAQKAR